MRKSAIPLLLVLLLLMVIPLGISSSMGGGVLGHDSSCPLGLGSCLAIVEAVAFALVLLLVLLPLIIVNPINPLLTISIDRPPKSD